MRHAEPVPPTPGEPDNPLTESGTAAAERLARELAGLKPTAVVSSQYERANETAAESARLEVTHAMGATRVGVTRVGATRVGFRSGADA
ncbi:histidine phosphatase family protein [Amycolatopsis sp. NPDC051071]|uniref:histidine phosphatase family protein n=1 Tax=Amycolatopsis sp. NPDC051071 TaxID=3154637 RepID=UPI0034451C5D